MENENRGEDSVHQKLMMLGYLTSVVAVRSPSDPEGRVMRYVWTDAGKRAMLEITALFVEIDRRIPVMPSLMGIEYGWLKSIATIGAMEAARDMHQRKPESTQDEDQ